ncbi:MAG: hypothetical protein H8D23_05190 [Candidatus Brocadiales bacterium]|nr:hypothetical protein [Candidatus Brocadiales bacterium]
MPDRFPFAAILEKEAKEFLQSLNERRGRATSNRQVGQRKRRLKEALYAVSATTTGNKTFSTDNPQSMQQAAIEALVEEVNIKDSVGEMLERYGSPSGGMLVDDSEYDDEIEEDQDEVHNDMVLFPKTATIFGDKDGFGDWMKNVYLSDRPMLQKMIDYNYWKVKDGSIHFGKERTPEAKAKAYKWVSYQLRKHISKNGIHPNTVTISNSTTILNYDAGEHTLNRGRM